MPAAPKRAVKIPSTARGSERFNHLRRQHRHAETSPMQLQRLCCRDISPGQHVSPPWRLPEWQSTTALPMFMLFHQAKGRTGHHLILAAHLRVAAGVNLKGQQSDQHRFLLLRPPLRHRLRQTNPPSLIQGHLHTRQ